MTSPQRLNRRTVGSIALGLLGFAGCMGKAPDVSIASHPLVLDASGVEFTLRKPLKRRFNSGSVLIELTEAWEPEPPWTAIRLSDGRLARISVVLGAEDGRVFSARIIGGQFGTGGARVQARFDPEVPKRASIHMVRIASSIPLHCMSVRWQDYDAE
jgi:hypothetical protein